MKIIAAFLLALFLPILAIAQGTCPGTPLPQAQAIVTSTFSFVAPGLAIAELTSNGCNRFYYFDSPAYSAPAAQLLYSNSTPAGNTVMSSKADGTGTKALASKTSGQVFVSFDGTLVAYVKGVRGVTKGGLDIYGGFLNATRPYSEIRITTLDVPPSKPLPVWEISPASLAPGGEVIAFSPDTFLHRQIVATSGKSMALPMIALEDPENAATFHRIRMNPKFPNIVLYKRNQVGGTSAQPEAWLVDLNTCIGNVCVAGNIINIVAGMKVPPNHVPKAGHINWSPDGRSIAFSEPDKADYWIAKGIVNGDATINRSFTLLEVGPFGKPQLTADYCAFPPSWPAKTRLACLSGPASTVNAKTLYLLSSDGLGAVQMLSSTDAQVITIAGTPMPQFEQDELHLVFNSDKSGIVQVYQVTGYKY